MVPPIKGIFHGCRAFSWNYSFYTMFYSFRNNDERNHTLISLAYAETKARARFNVTNSLTELHQITVVRALLQVHTARWPPLCFFHRNSTIWKTVQKGENLSPSTVRVDTGQIMTRIINALKNSLSNTKTWRDKSVWQISRRSATPPLLTRRTKGCVKASHPFWPY